MATGLLPLICLRLGQTSNEYYNYRNHRIPATYNDGRRGETDKVLLYLTTDQGRNWSLADSIPNTKDEFVFHATTDGIYGLSVAMVNKQGKQEPDEKTIMTSPPQLKMIIDTQ